MKANIGHIAICIATYRRPDSLGELLDSLTTQVLARGERAVVIVVDNDPHLSAKSVAEAHPLMPHYLSEPRPGIAAARNRALDALEDAVDWVAFVDDDETVAADWLDQFERYIAAHRPQVVTGPVISIFPPSTPGWMVRGGFIQRPSFPSGVYRFPPATNNTLVEAGLFRAVPLLRFADAFSLTGGSDTELFTRLRRIGVTFHYCVEAQVTEIVPVSRANWRWVWSRGVRAGNVAARIQLERTSRWLVAFGGVARLCAGVLRTVLALMAGQGLRHVDCQLVMRGVGFLKAAFGVIDTEYARPVEASTS